MESDMIKENEANSQDIDFRMETKDLIIRRFSENDWKDLYEYLSNPLAVEFEPYDVHSQSDCIREAKRRSLDKNFYAVVLKEENKVIGNLYFAKEDYDTWEIGYVFNLVYQKKGYATQSAKALIDYAISNWGARRIIAECNVINTDSWRLMERLHMRREGHYLQRCYFKKDKNNQPIWIDAYLYAILSQEWIAMEKQDKANS